MLLWANAVGGKQLRRAATCTRGPEGRKKMEMMKTKMETKSRMMNLDTGSGRPRRKVSVDDTKRRRLSVQVWRFYL